MKFLTITTMVACLVLSACVSVPKSNQPPALTVNAKGVPSHYKVQKGDTVSSIAKRYELNWREVANLNRLDSNHTIQSGQWLTLWKVDTTTKKAPMPVTQPLVVQQPSAQAVSTLATPVPAPIAPTAMTDVVPPAMPVRPRFVPPVPQDSTVVRHFGMANNANVKSEGVWFRSEENAPVVAVADGRVSFVDESSANGIFIHIRHADGVVSEYRFVKKLKVEPNQVVKAGQQIASTRKANSGSVITEFRLSRHGVYIDPMMVLLK